VLVKKPAMTKRLQSYTAPGITVRFNPNLCYHSAVCLRTLPAVFDVRRRKWIEPEAASVDDVVAAVNKCPSGALTCVREGSTVQADEGEEDRPAVAMIQARPDGPLLIQGSFVIQDESGRTIGSGDRAALCRCGQTVNPPFCDGSHLRSGYRSRTSGTA